MGASVLALLVVQGSLTALGAVLGDVMPAAQVAALTATGGLMLVGVALRLLRIKQVPVGDLLPGPAGRAAADRPGRGAALTVVRTVLAAPHALVVDLLPQTLATAAALVLV